MDDLATVTQQLGRVPRAFRCVAARCPFGAPAVTEQVPYAPGGEPFPTMYYLTCRHLVAAVSRLEAAGGVERWSALLAGDAALPASLEAATAEQASLRLASAAGQTGNDGGSSLTHRDRRLAHPAAAQVPACAHCLRSLPPRVRAR